MGGGNVVAQPASRTAKAQMIGKPERIMSLRQWWCFGCAVHAMLTYQRKNGVASARVTIMHDTASLASGSYRPRGTARTCVSVWCLSVGYEHEEIGASECGTGVGPPRVSVTLT